MVLTIQTLWFHMNFRIDFFCISVKNGMGLLVRIALNLCIVFGKILIKPIHKHGMFLHFLLSLSISLLRVLKLFSLKKYFISLIRFVCSYFLWGLLMEVSLLFHFLHFCWWCVQKLLICASLLSIPPHCYVCLLLSLFVSL